MGHRPRNWASAQMVRCRTHHTAPRALGGLCIIAVCLAFQLNAFTLPGQVSKPLQVGRGTYALQYTDAAPAALPEPRAVSAPTSLVILAAMAVLASVASRTFSRTTLTGGRHVVVLNSAKVHVAARPCHMHEVFSVAKEAAVVDVGELISLAEAPVQSLPRVIAKELSFDAPALVADADVAVPFVGIFQSQSQSLRVRSRKKVTRKATSDQRSQQGSYGSRHQRRSVGQWLLNRGALHDAPPTQMAYDPSRLRIKIQHGIFYTRCARNVGKCREGKSQTERAAHTGYLETHTSVRVDCCRSSRLNNKECLVGFQKDV